MNFFSNDVVNGMFNVMKSFNGGFNNNGQGN